MKRAGSSVVGSLTLGSSHSLVTAEKISIQPRTKSAVLAAAAVSLGGVACAWRIVLHAAGEPFDVAGLVAIHAQHPSLWLLDSLPIVFAGLVYRAIAYSHGMSLSELEAQQKHAREPFLAGVVGAVGDGIVVFDARGKIHLANEAARRLWSKLPSDWKARHLSELFPDNFPTALYDGWRRTPFSVVVDRPLTFRPSGDDRRGVWEVLFSKTHLNGEPFVTCTVRDRTEHELVDEKLDETRRRLEHLLTLSPTLLYCTKPSDGYACTFASDNLADLTGHESSAMLEDADFWFSHLHPDDVADVMEKFDSAVAAGSGLIEYRFRRADGSYVWVQDSFRVAHDDRGNPFEIVGTWVDITETRLANEERDTIFGVVRDMIGVTNLDGEFMRLNPAFESTLGYDSTELQSKTLVDLVDPDDYSIAVAHWKQALSTSGDFRFELRTLCGDSSTKWIAWSTVADHDRQRVFLVGREITDWKQHEAELIAAREAAIEATQAKSSFLATMSHEIRTPMNGVLGMIDLLAKSDLTDEQRDYVATARGSGEALLTLIGDILDYSKIEAGKLALESVRFDLRGTVESTTRLFANTAHSRGVEISCFVSPDVPARVLGDPTRVRQVLSNLISNGLKFTEEGEVAISVQRNPAAGPHHLRLEVADTGVGISREDQEHLFQRFSQVDSSTARRFGGTGLGLAICRQIVELMGGTITLESTPGEGSVFHFDLPFPPHCGAAVVEDLADLPESACVLTQSDRLWQVFSGYVDPLGVAVSRLRTVDELLAHVESDSSDLCVLVDRHSCADLAEVIRRVRDRRTDVRVVVIAQISYRQRAAESDGADTCLQKPLVRNRIIDVLSGRVTESRADEIDDEGIVAGRVLLAEDNEVNRIVSLGLLGDLCDSIDVAKNGVEALELFQQNRYDLVLMDCLMPKMDGYVATGKMREWEATQGLERTPIVALTANASAADSLRCRQVGMDDHVSKPVCQSELRRALREWAVRKTSTKSSDGRACDACGSVEGAEVLGATDSALVESFLAKALQLIGEIRGAAECTNLDDAARSAHELKSLSATVEASLLAQVAAEVEARCRLGDQECLEPLFDQLDSEYEGVIEARSAQTQDFAGDTA